MTYNIHKCTTVPHLPDGPGAPEWRNAEHAGLTHFRPEGSSHRPVVTAQLLHNDNTIFGLFLVQDRYVLSRHGEYMSSVCQDSCVELFIAPGQNTGYFNFEFNCGGTMLCSYICDPSRTPAGFKDCKPVDPADAAGICVTHSMPERVEQELLEPVDWWLSFSIPVSLLEKYAGPIAPLREQALRGNFYKCADASSHPHWASWAPVRELNFHMPDCFGVFHCR